MLSDGWQKPIVLCHNLESFPEGCLMVGCGHALCQIIGKRLMNIEVLHTSLLPFLQTTDAPVEVS